MRVTLLISAIVIGAVAPAGLADPVWKNPWKATANINRLARSQGVDNSAPPGTWHQPIAERPEMLASVGGGRAGRQYLPSHRATLLSWAEYIGTAHIPGVPGSANPLPVTNPGGDPQNPLPPSQQPGIPLVPAPESWSLFLIGVGVAACLRRRVGFL